MRYPLLNILLVLLTAIVLAGCEKENSASDIKLTKTTIEVLLPMGMDELDKDSFIVRFQSKNTGRTDSVFTDMSGKAIITLLEGIYDIQVSGTKMRQSANGNEEQQAQFVELIGSSEKIRITGATVNLDIPLLIKGANKGWVFKEIFFSASYTPEGKNYVSDQFIEIYNNTDTVMYADGISVAESMHNTKTNNINLYAADINEYTYVRTVYTIPGSGTDYPVEPGKSILIAPQPINHKEHNPLSFDLSSADFQWYDKYSTTIDAPEVENMIRYYSYSNTIWILHVNGYCSLLIFKTGEDMAKFVQNNTDMRPNSVGKTATSIRIPNEYILDAVELGSSNDFNVKAFSPALDFGYTYCTKAYSGKSVRRKTDKVIDGRVVYLDTNNSAIDFITNADPKPRIFGEE